MWSCPPGQGVKRFDVLTISSYACSESLPNRRPRRPVAIVVTASLLPQIELLGTRLELLGTRLELAWNCLELAWNSLGTAWNCLELAWNSLGTA